MAPYRGRGRGRGGGQGVRGGRGGRGGQGQTGRGGRGGVKDNVKLARSGIKTRAGYRKFDSQRVKDLEDSEESADELVNGGEIGEDGVNGDDDLSEDDHAETISTAKAYTSLLQSFQEVAADDDRHSRKRRKIEREVTHSSSLADKVSAVESGADDHEDVGQDDKDLVEATNDAVGRSAEDPDLVEDLSDPFEVQYAYPDDNELSKRLKNVQANEWHVDKQTVLGNANLVLYIPKSIQNATFKKPAASSVSDLPLKKRLIERAKSNISVFNEQQKVIAPYLFNYTDILLGNRTPENASSLRSLACLHALNHVLKGRDKVLKNTTRLAQEQESENLDPRDQGFTRPKVLILTETRQVASKYADSLVDFFAPEQQENEQRFQDSFTAPIVDRESMPEDYRELFDGNNDNSFLMALKLTRKTLKYYSAFYTSDIILASPLGLRRVIEHEDVKKRDYDFLSSIEVVIFDQADAMQMQNWENVEIVFNHLNLEVKDAHGADFSRIRNWYLDGHALYLRQTIGFAAYITPEMNRLFNSSMLNVAGKLKLAPSYEGAITETGGLGIKQTFPRFDSPSPAMDPDARFKYFTSAILPSLLRLPKPADGAQGLLVFIPSYYDFLRVRNFFATATLTQNISYGAIHDYSDVSEQRRARSHFLSGRHSILLYTQRAHHFFRLRIRGVKRVVMYGLPDNPIFYQELVGGFLGTSVGEGRLAPEESSVRCMFSKWDGLRLERVVGSGRVKSMLAGVGDTFQFV